jgi:hypothetical protein
LGAERVSLVHKLPTELFVVVDLTVEHGPHGFISIGKRLMSTSEIDDAQPTKRQPGRSRDQKTLVVWPSVRKSVCHPLE